MTVKSKRAEDKKQTWAAHTPTRIKTMLDAIARQMSIDKGVEVNRSNALTVIVEEYFRKNRSRMNRSQANGK